MSSDFSPTPIYFTGSPTCWRIATTTPPLAVPSSLAKTIPVQFTASVNFDAWLMPFCPVVASSTSNHFVRRGRNLLANRLLNLRQLGHQILLRLQPAGRVDDAHIGPGFDRLLDRPIGHARRVGVRRAGDDRHAQPIAPNRELLDRRRPKRVAGAEHHFLALRLQQLGELGDRRRFAAAVHAADHDHRRPAFGEFDRRIVLRHQRQQLVLNRLEQLLAASPRGRESRSRSASMICSTAS